MYEYTNKNGIKFYINIEEALVPDDADYFRYLFEVRLGDEQSDRGLEYKATVKKELCDTKEKAQMWRDTTALVFLNSILETYRDGKTQLLIPSTDKWWFSV